MPRLHLAVFTGCVLFALSPATFGQEQTLRYGRDVAPILSEFCFACHGPDEESRYADLRLDDREAALEAGAFVPGDAAGSRIIKRMRHHDDDLRMPPPETKKAPSEEQIAIIARWVDEGAPYEAHWAFVAPRKVSPPTPEDPAWAGGAIDRFLRQTQTRKGLGASGLADRRTLARRASLDLRGLPPSPEELAAFLTDRTPEAWERYVDRLIASPHYGERMALPWLDAARYADTNGYHHDYYRAMWPWRDWVIRAFNQNLPYDRFLVEQLAGDLLPEASAEQRLASGFNRNHMVNNEGGAIPEEYQVEYVVDRVRTTSSVFLGLTMACAQCHDHKYDPISQAEYYRFYDFFNRVPEKGLDGDRMAAAPSMRLPSDEEKAREAEAISALEAARARLNEPRPEVDRAQAAWERATAAAIEDDWVVLEPKAASGTGGVTFTIEDDHSLIAGGPNPGASTYTIDLKVPAAHANARAIWMEVLMDERIDGGGPARNFHGNFVLSEFEAERLEDDPEGTALRFTDARADYSQRRYDIRRAIDGNRGTGWAIDGHKRRANRNAVFVTAEPLGRAGDDAVLRLRLHQEYGSQHCIGRMRFRIARHAGPAAATTPAARGAWSLAGPFPDARRTALRQDFGPEADADLDATYSFRGQDYSWSPRPAYVDGKTHVFKGEDNRTGVFYFRRTIHCDTPRVLRAGFGSDDALAVFLNGRRVHLNDVARGVAADQDIVELPLVAGENVLLMKILNTGGAGGMYFRRHDEYAEVLPGDVARALPLATADRDDRGRNAVRDFYRRRRLADWPDLVDEVARQQRGLADARASITRVMVMSDAASMSRKTHILERGLYSAKGDVVNAGVPRALPPLPDVENPNRLHLAEWMVQPDHPLTARVFVNRIWQVIFGRGLVATVEDFGTQGSLPSHPELLDWLAVDFVESGWDIKRLVKNIVMSRTYRQSARRRADLAEADPENLWLARAPSYRLDAETIRDNALAIAGLLKTEIGGPSVKPYQPEGLWKELTFAQGEHAKDDFYRRDMGDKLYRRGIYTYWKRSCPPPQLQTFDAPTREVCTLRRARTNTPLQALVLLNDETYLEAARVFAERILREASSTKDAARVDHAFTLALSRPARDSERRVLMEYLAEQRGHWAADENAARAFLSAGEAPRVPSIPVAEHAAWTAVASLILNLDETLTRR